MSTAWMSEQERYIYSRRQQARPDKPVPFTPDEDALDITSVRSPKHCALGTSLDTPIQFSIVVGV
jgi:hypothetical protein